MPIAMTDRTENPADSAAVSPVSEVDVESYVERWLQEADLSLGVVEAYAGWTRQSKEDLTTESPPSMNGKSQRNEDAEAPPTTDDLFDRILRCGYLTRDSKQDFTTESLPSMNAVSRRNANAEAPPTISNLFDRIMRYEDLTKASKEVLTVESPLLMNEEVSQDANLEAQSTRSDFFDLIIHF